MEPALHIFSDSKGNEFLRFNGVDRPILSIPFIYQMPTFAAIAAAGGTQQQVIQVDSGSDFLWTDACMAYDLALAAFVYNAQPIPNMSIALSDSGESYNFMNASVPVMSIFGRPGIPQRLPLPYLFAGSATITGLVTNYDAASATGNLRLSFIGRKIRYLSQQR